MRMIFCQKLQKETEGLERSPYPGALGERIFLNISKEAWKQWQQRQIMYINEYRLNMLDPNAHKLLADEMEKFLFSDESQLPQGYIPTEGAN